MAAPDTAKLFTALSALGVPMKGWWADSDADEFGPAYGVEVAAEALRDSDADWTRFEWSAEDGWTMSDGYAVTDFGSGPSSTVALDLPATAGVDEVAAYLKRVLDGEIDGFRTLSYGGRPVGGAS